MADGWSHELPNLPSLDQCHSSNLFSTLPLARPQRRRRTELPMDPAPGNEVISWAALPKSLLASTHARTPNQENENTAK